MQSKRKLLVLLFWILILTLPAFAQTQDLSSAEWYSVVWARGDDTLHWISPNGEPASILRPKLPDESANANPQMRFSRDGRYMVLVPLSLTGGLNGIGIYDIQAGQFVQTHQAQPDEVIYLGRDHTSNLSATQMLLSDLLHQISKILTWRIIIFDLGIWFSNWGIG